MHLARSSALRGASLPGHLDGSRSRRRLSEATSPARSARTDAATAPVSGPEVETGAAAAASRRGGGGADAAAASLALRGSRLRLGPARPPPRPPSPSISTARRYLPASISTALRVVSLGLVLVPASPRPRPPCLAWPTGARVMSPAAAPQPSPPSPPPPRLALRRPRASLRVPERRPGRGDPGVHGDDRVLLRRGGDTAGAPIRKIFSRRALRRRLLTPAAPCSFGSLLGRHRGPPRRRRQPLAPLAAASAAPSSPPILLHRPLRRCWMRRPRLRLGEDLRAHCRGRGRWWPRRRAMIDATFSWMRRVTACSIAAWGTAAGDRASMRDSSSSLNAARRLPYRFRSSDCSEATATATSSSIDPAEDAKSGAGVAYGDVSTPPALPTRRGLHRRRRGGRGSSPAGRFIWGGVGPPVPGGGLEVVELAAALERLVRASACFPARSRICPRRDDLVEVLHVVLPPTEGADWGPSPC